MIARRMAAPYTQTSSDTSKIENSIIPRTAVVALTLLTIRTSCTTYFDVEWHEITAARLYCCQSPTATAVQQTAVYYIYLGEREMNGLALSGVRVSSGTDNCCIMDICCW